MKPSGAFCLTPLPAYDTFTGHRISFEVLFQHISFSDRRRKKGRGMVRDHVFVFDNASHMYGYSDENLKHADGEFDRRFGVGIKANKKELGLLEKTDL